MDASTSVDYANAIHYWANGSPCWEDYGAGITGAEAFNSRQQPLDIQASTGVVTYQGGCPGLGQTGNLIDLQYCYTNWQSGVCQTSTTDNGNVNGIVNNIDGTRSQGFSYDALNRITTGETPSTYSTSPSHCWGESFFYDNNSTAGGAWGNLTTIGVANSTYNGCTQESLSQSATADNQISGFCYDAAGNLLGESVCPASTYTYNAENELKSTAGVSYTYDGDGKRVEKSSGTLYWYGPNSNVLDETDLSGNVTNEYVYLGGQRIARLNASGNAFYYLADQLGTSRVIAEVPSGTTTATLCYDADFYPFGGERAYTDSCDSHYKFTGKERDTESNLDNFGARYFTSNMGRFMSPDPLGGHLFDPQTLNKYVYVRDNPLTLTDPTGLYGVNCTAGTTKDQKKCTQAADRFEKQRLKDLKSKKADVRKAAAAWGSPNDKNGITVTFKSQKEVNQDSPPPPGTNTQAFVQPGASGSKPDIQAEFSEDLHGGDLAQTIAHEGSHLEDDMAFISSFNPAAGMYDASTNFTHFDTEYSAFVTGSMVKPYPGLPAGPSQQLTNYIFKYYPNAMEPVFPPALYPQETVPQ